MSAHFVTGTGTDVGKTFVTRALIGALRSRGAPGRALKPIVTGYSPAEAAGSDSGLLLAALGRPLSPEALAQISPWRFAAPLAPDMAAAREGRRLDYAAMIEFCRTAIADTSGPLLIEGVGGVMSPLDDEHTVLDWMAALAVPLIVVAGSYLGTISHTLTGLDAIARRGLRVASLVVSETAGSPVRLDETRDAIARFAPDLEVLSLPRLRKPQHPTLERIAARL